VAIPHSPKGARENSIAAGAKQAAEKAGFGAKSLEKHPSGPKDPLILQGLCTG
jgi:hypothetical protein